jgi:CopG family nickel-responsive transcriptional regulator
MSGTTTTRFGVSLDADLLERFDEIIERRHYTNRSEAIRDLIRNTLVDSEWERERGMVVGTVTMVYDHHVPDLTARLTDIQHDHASAIVSAMHVHLDHDNCLEVLVVRGRASQIRDFADRIRSVRGVKHATLAMTSTGKNLA